jgi:hypothetical protein
MAMEKRDTSHLIAPTLNINGSNGKTLLSQHRAAAKALREAIIAVHAIWPHGRDFQTVPEGVYSVASKQARERCIKLEEVLIDVEAVAEKIYEQIK